MIDQSGCRPGLPSCVVMDMPTDVVRLSTGRAIAGRRTPFWGSTRELAAVPAQSTFAASRVAAAEAFATRNRRDASAEGVSRKPLIDYDVE